MSEHEWLSGRHTHKLVQLLPTAWAASRRAPSDRQKRLVGFNFFLAGLALRGETTTAVNLACDAATGLAWIDHLGPDISRVGVNLASMSPSEFFAFSLHQYVTYRGVPSHWVVASHAAAVNVLRDVIGNPFQPRASLDNCPYCTTDDMTERYGRVLRCHGCCNETPLHPWLTETVLDLAQAAYDDLGQRKCTACDGGGDKRLVSAGGPKEGHQYSFCRLCGGHGLTSEGSLDPDRLAVLADALEDAGCNEPWILNHLRGLVEVVAGSAPHERRWMKRTGPHVRGCHVVDLLLGKG